MNTHGCVYLVISVHMQYDYVLNKCRVKAQTHQLRCNFFRSVISLRGGEAPAFAFFFSISLCKDGTTDAFQRVPSVQTCAQAAARSPPPGPGGSEADARPSFHSQQGPHVGSDAGGLRLLPWKPELQ